jgi:hypothetical protein
MSDLLQQFADSMNIDYEKWHDGVGYEVNLLSQMSQSELESVEELLLSRGIHDWRDLEALHVLGSDRAWNAVLAARTGASPELRLYAMKYGPPPTESDLEFQILEDLTSPDRMGRAIDSAVDCPTPAIKERLIEVARTADAPYGYSAAAMLFEIAGIIDSHWDLSYRDFFLRFSSPPGSARDIAAQELRAKIGL